MVHVALIRGEERRKTTRKAVDDLGHAFWQACRDASYVFVKVDLGFTDFEALRGVLDATRLYANAPMVIGDSPVLGARDIFKSDDFYNLTQAYPDLHLLDLTHDDMIESVFRRDDGGELVVRRAKTALEAPLRIVLGHTADWALGTWVVPARETSRGKAWNREPWLEALSPGDRERLIAELFSAHPCHAAVVSGIVSGDGVAASMDPVALDTLRVFLQGGDAHSVDHLEILASMGPWTNEIAELDIPPLVLQEFMQLS